MTDLHQLTLDEIRRARPDGPTTSLASAARSHGLTHAHETKILAVLRDAPHALSAHEIAAQADLTPVQVSRRLGQLRDDGEIVVDETRTAQTPSGREAQTWRLA